MKQSLLLTVLCVTVFSTTLKEQSLSINIWQSKVPGSIVNSDFKQFVDSADNWIKMRHVTNPSLDMYPASADKSPAQPLLSVLVEVTGVWPSLTKGHKLQLGLIVWE